MKKYIVECMIVWYIGYDMKEWFWQELTGIEHRTYKKAKKELEWAKKNGYKDLRIKEIEE